MTVKLEIIADDTFDLHRQLKQVLQGDTNMHFLDAARPRRTGMAAELAAPYEAVEERMQTTGPIGPQPADAEQQLLDGGASTEFAAAQVEGKKRGRKPGSKNTPKSESEVAPSASETSAAESSPAPEKTAAAAEAGSPSPNAAAHLISFDEFKKRLNDVQGANGDNLRHITAILNEHGYAKVKEVKAEDYGSILAKCAELTGAN